MRRLNLSLNWGLQLAPRCFSGLRALKELDLSSGGLTAVPSEVLSGVGRTLRRLDLSRNVLQLAPRCFSGLSALEQLDLSVCRLTAVPDESVPGVARTLRRLHLCSNRDLQLAPRCFSGLSVLEELGLIGCGVAADHAALVGVQCRILGV